jgi:NitT/TauT family transport system permease protein
MSAAIVAGRIGLFLGLAALWQLAHAWLGAGVVADLVEIGRRIGELAASGKLARHASVTLLEAGAGLAIGAAAGFAAPFLLRLAPRLEAALDPYIAAAMGVPKLALAPLLILWFGIGLASKIAFVAAVAFFLVFFSTLSGIRAADPRLVAVARVFGARRWLLAREVLMPAAAPFVLASLKVAAPRAVSAAVVGEFIAADAGLGFYIHEAMSQADTVGIFAGVVVVTAIVVAINAALERFQRRALGWREAGLSGF